jgi:hypothetical protein
MGNIRDKIGEMKAQHLAFNAASRTSWPWFSEHRERVLNLIRSHSRQPAASGALAVLGAGNCNDLDLTQLLKKFATVDLVDLDQLALDAGIARQGLSGEPRLRCIGNTDVTSALEALAAWSSGCVNTAVGLSRQRPSGLAAHYDVVLSSCLFSQLVASVVYALGEAHVNFMDWVLCLRQRHVQQLIELTRPGGVAILVNDLVSSDSAPSLLGATNDNLISLMGELLETGNFFHGCSPFAIAQACRRTPEIASRLGDLRITSPWRWDIGRQRAALVYGVILTATAPPA